MTPVQIETQRLYRENADLRAKLEAALAELKRRAEEGHVLGLRAGLGLTLCEAEILAALWRANGRPVSTGCLSDITEQAFGNTDHGLATIKTAICHIRAKLDGAVIETVRGYGYRLTDEGRELCRNAIRPVPTTDDLGDMIVSIARVA